MCQAYEWEYLMQRAEEMRKRIQKAEEDLKQKPKPAAPAPAPELEDREPVPV